MKKWLFGLLLVVAGLCAAFYFFIPSSASVTYNAVVKANQSTVYRCFTTESLLRKWWSGAEIVSAGKNFIVKDNDLRFTITPNVFDVVNIRIEQGQTPVQSFINALPLQKDSSAVIWKAELPAGGFFTNVRNYFHARKLKRNMAGVLERFQQFLQSEKNIYGLSITREKVSDTLLVVTKLRDTEKPTVEKYYGLIKKLRTYIAAQGAQETNYPMLHIFETDSNRYETMVAIPINKKVPDNGAILLKRMVAGNILVAEVKGGPGAIEEGFSQLDFYMNEHGMRQPGLPFQSLVTDRPAEKDTAKWTTKLYYPVL